MPYTRGALPEPVGSAPGRVGTGAWPRRSSGSLGRIRTSWQYHFRQAGDTRAGDWLIRAGERARRSYAWLTAAARFETALPFLPADGAAPQRCALLGYLAWLCRYADPLRAVAHMDEAFALASAAGDLAYLAER